MFSPVAMTRLSVVVLQQDERAVLRELGRAGVMQLTRTAAGPETAPLAPRDRSVETARLAHLSVRLGALRQALALPAAVEPVETTEMSPAEAEHALGRMEDEAGPAIRRRRELMERVEELAAVDKQLSDYRELDLPLDRPDESSFLHFVTGTLPAQNLGKLAADARVALVPLVERNGRRLVVALTTRQNRAALDNALQQAGFQAESLPVTAGATTQALAEKNQRELDAIHGELARLDSTLQKCAGEWAAELDEIESLVGVERRLVEAGQNFPRTETTVLLTGWMPGDAAVPWQQRLREITHGCCVIGTAGPGATDEEQIPVLLRHPGWLRPFELLVSTYGLPKYHEFEPTLLVAVSFLVMFGMMFGDVGDGLILAAGGVYALVRGHSPGWRNAGLLLLFAGTASTIAGAVYGSYFGIPSLQKYALWHDPLAGDPMRLMRLSIEAGIVMISLGLVLNVYNRFRRGDGIGGCLDKFGVAGMVFYWGMLFLFVNYAKLQARGEVAGFFALFFGVPLVCWMLKEPVEFFHRRLAGHPTEPGRDFGAVVLESLVEVFEGVLGYFANTISFVRLAAYSMSHAALLMTTFMVAAELRHLSPAGGLLSLGVIILGNVIALVLEGVIASVQALRLEYYEFFGKFFSGGGQPFRPFRLSGGDAAG